MQRCAGAWERASQAKERACAKKAEGPGQEEGERRVRRGRLRWLAGNSRELAGFGSLIK